MGLGRTMDQAWKDAISAGLKAKGSLGSALGNAKIRLGTEIDRFKAKGSSAAIKTSEASKRASVVKNRTLGGKLRMASGNAISGLKSAVTKGEALRQKAISKTADAIPKVEALRQKAIRKTSDAMTAFRNQAGANTYVAPKKQTAAEKMRSKTMPWVK